MMSLIDSREYTRRVLVYAQLKELNHDNVNAFVGASIEPGNICYLMQCCSRGTVQVSPFRRSISTLSPALL